MSGPVKCPDCEEIVQSDAQLVQSVLGGDERAFRELVDRHRAKIFTFIVKIVKNREDANDIAQEVFIKIYHALDSFDPSKNFSSWLFKIAQNMSIDHLRKKRIDHVSIDETRETSRGEISMQIPSADLEPDRELEGMEVGEALEVAISELDPVYHSAIMLRHVEGKSYDEIADILDMPLGTVKTTIFRARKSLRQKLKRLLPGHDLKR